MEAHVPGGEEMLSEQSRTGLKPEVVFIIYFWFIFRKLREFLYLNAAFLVLEYTFLGRTEYFSSLTLSSPPVYFCSKENATFSLPEIHFLYLTD